MSLQGSEEDTEDLRLYKLDMLGFMHRRSQRKVPVATRHASTLYLFFMSNQA